MKRPLANILSVASADLLSRLIGFVTTAYLARTLGAQSFGIMSIGLVVLGHLFLFSSPGVHILGTRDIAAGVHQTVAYTRKTLALRLLLSLFLFLGTVLACILFVGDPLLSLTTVLFASALFPMAVSLDWYFQGKERMDLVSVAKVLLSLVNLGMVVVLVGSPEAVPMTAIAFVAANIAASLLLGGIFTREHARIPIAMRADSLMSLLRRSLPLGVTSLLAQTITGAPVLIVAAILSTANAGFFNAAMKIIFLALLADRVLYAVFLPMISRYRTESSDQFMRVVRLTMKVVIGLSLPIAILGVRYAGDIVALVYGTGFGQSVETLQVLWFYYGATLVNTIFMSVLLAQNREHEYLSVMLWGTGIMLVLCLVLTYVWGIVGAAASLGIGEAVMVLLFAFRMMREFRTRRLRVITPSLISGAVMVAVLFVAEGVPTAGSILLGLGAFALVFWSLRGLTRDDISLLWEILL